MKIKEKIIIEFNYPTLNVSIIIGFVLAILTHLYFNIHNYLSIFNLYLILTIKFFLLCFIFAYLIGLSYMLYILIKHDLKIIVIDRNGIWLPHYDVIPWSNIREIVIYPELNGKMNMLGINLKDIGLQYKNTTSLMVKYELFCSKFFRRKYQITRGAMNFDSDEILDLSKKFLK